jgi:hypothetical protein
MCVSVIRQSGQKTRGLRELSLRDHTLGRTSAVVAVKASAWVRDARSQARLPHACSADLRQGRLFGAEEGPSRSTLVEQPSRMPCL